MNFDKEKEELKKQIDIDARSLYTDERKLNKFQLNEKLFFVTNSLWDSFQNELNPKRQKIQNLESDILINRYQLDETLKKHCQSKQNFKRAEKELDDVEQNLDRHRLEMKNIEEYCNTEESEGDLKRLPMWVFWLLMTIVGLAELSVYYYVFLSQEIGLGIEFEDLGEKVLYYGTAWVMAIGFTVMLIWLSHKLGMMLRQYVSVHKNVKKSYIIRYVVISIVIFAAIVSTVMMRAKMHQITDIRDQIKILRDKGFETSLLSMEDIGNTFKDVAIKNNTMINEEMEMENSLGDQNEMEMNIDDSTKSSANSTKVSSEIDKPKSESSLREAINLMKGDLAYLFIFINLFIVIAGIFLSYAVHTSSIKYEALEGMIKRLHKRRETLVKTKQKLEQELLKNEKGELLSIVTKFVQSVNEFDEYSQIIKSYKIYIENVYIEMVYYMIGTMLEHDLFANIDEKTLEEYRPEYLSERFSREWKLERIDIEVPEVIHANNMDEYLELFKCQETEDETSNAIKKISDKENNVEEFENNKKEEEANV